MRMRESARPPGTRILDDPWAGALVRGERAVQALRFARFLLPPLWLAIDELATAHCVRHRAIDELVLRAVERDGFGQVVVVGAGYDMRPSRFARRIAGVRWIEADLPALSAHKRRLLSALAGANRDVVFAPVDLRAGSLAEALDDAGVDPARPACVILEGLLHYLPRGRVEALFGDLARRRGPTRVLASYIRPDVFASARGRIVGLVRLSGEIPHLCFRTEELAALGAAHGFGACRAWTFAEQVQAFAPEGRHRRAGAAQDVAQLDRRGVS